MWDVASGTILRRLQGHFGKVFSVVFNKDAQVLASGEAICPVSSAGADGQLGLTRR